MCAAFPGVPAMGNDSGGHNLDRASSSIGFLDIRPLTNSCRAIASDSLTSGGDRKMKSNFVRLSVVFALFALTPQVLPAVSAVAAGQNSNSSMMGESMRAQPGHSRRGRSSRCTSRCSWTYRSCVRSAGDNRGRRRACAVRYRNCVRRCSR